MNKVYFTCLQKCLRFCLQYISNLTVFLRCLILLHIVVVTAEFYSYIDPTVLGTDSYSIIYDAIVSRLSFLIIFGPFCMILSSSVLPTVKIYLQNRDFFKCS